MPLIASLDALGLDWSGLAGALVGGFATLLAALLSFWLGRVAERKRQDDIDRKRSAGEATSAFHKLCQWANLLANIDQQIKAHFKQAEEDGVTEVDAFLNIGPVAGKLLEPDRIRSSELRFLQTKENFQILEMATLVEQRAANIHEIYRLYTIQYLALQDWLDSISGFERQYDGPVAHDIIPEGYRSGFETRGAQLNRLLAGVCEQLEQDLPFTTEAVQKFADAAHSKFPNDFPKIKFGADERAAE
ncbi:hypothetical protein SAMN06297129_1724 [Pseudooceanicola antarcticus]|uniref:Uncharacterized protein n=1 Tax=Pseudooceanicola antarcticus TaxID=1247613 RepID=A0A285IQC0_9RHOB|nr:hypothetical protein [Pseudooceanicola antarcticus]PJE31704.1 hypothetical protein CVM39_00960 [Pseudooceanicola antarcticus]SNY50209.1 hypothetical protein SAMN06297129_1724 [Pseudooceanicola antarcticus]